MPPVPLILFRIGAAIHTAVCSLAVGAYDRMTGRVTRSEHWCDVIVALLPRGE